MAEELLAVGQNGNTYNTKIFITSNHIDNSKRQSINGKEFDTYRVGVEKNSCSTMHKIHAKEFTLEDFSTEHLLGNEVDGWNHPGQSTYGMMWDIVDKLNECRELYLKTKDKKYWWQMIQLLPSSYNQTRNIMMNYEVLANIYKSRKNHKLDEWREFCKWIEELPYSELICGPEFLRKDFHIPDEKNDIVDKLCVIGNQNPLTAEEIRKLLGQKED